MNPNIKFAAKAVGIPSPDVVRWLRAHARAVGLDERIVPDIKPFRFIRLAEVARMRGCSVSTVYREIASGALPKPVSLDRVRAKQEAA